VFTLSSLQSLFSSCLVHAIVNCGNQAYPRLLVSHTASEWQVHKCVNCGDLTHATSAKHVGQVLVYAGLPVSILEFVISAFLLLKSSV
jgi:hypothetical protein